MLNIWIYGAVIALLLASNGRLIANPVQPLRTWSYGSWSFFWI